MQHASERGYDRKATHMYKLYPIFELKYEKLYRCTPDERGAR